MGALNLLLDSCAFLWLAVKPAKLSSAAKAAIEDRDSDLYLSDASVWEIALKHSKGKLPLPEAPRFWIPRQVAFFQIKRLPIDAEALFRSAELPSMHQDPFDRLLAAQALAGPLRLISPDAPFRAYAVDCIW